jgi:hypothetical protein
VPTLNIVATNGHNTEEPKNSNDGVIHENVASRTTPVNVPDGSDEVGEPTTEFVMPNIVTTQPSGEVPQVQSVSKQKKATSAPAFLGVRRQVVLRRSGGRPRVRRVSRVLRHIDPWSTFKVAALFSLVTYVVLLTAGVMLWRVADTTGTIANVERWFTQFGWETFELHGDEIFGAAWVIGLFLVVAATGAAVLFATIFNLISDVVGGVRLSVLEEEVTERTFDPIEAFRRRRPD